MFCEKCGQANPDGAKFCEGCGAALPEAPAAATNNAADVFNQTVENLKNNDLVKKIIKIAIPVVAVVVVLLLLNAFGVFKKPYVNAVEKYIKSGISLDYKTRLTIEYDKYELEQMDKELKEVIEDAKEDKEDDQERLEDIYGKGYRIESLEIRKTKEYSKNEAKKVSEYFEKYMKYDEDAIQGVAIVDCKYKIKGEDEDATFKPAYIMIKVDGKWTVYNSYYAQGDKKAFEVAKDTVTSWKDAAESARDAKKNSDND